MDSHQLNHEILKQIMSEPIKPETLKDIIEQLSPVLYNLINQHQQKEQIEISVTFKCPQKSYLRALQKAESLNITIEKFIENALSYYLTFYDRLSFAETEENNPKTESFDPLSILQPNMPEYKRGRGRPKMNKNEQIQQNTDEFKQDEIEINKFKQDEIEINKMTYFNVASLVEYLKFRLNKIGKHSYILTQQKIYNLVKRNLLPNVRIGVSISFKKSEIDAWFEDKGAKYLYQPHSVSLPKSNKYQRVKPDYEDNKVFDIKELIEYLPKNPSKKTLYKLIKQRKIPFWCSIDGEYKFSKMAIDKWLIGKSKRRKHLLEEHLPKTDNTYLPNLSEINVSRTSVSLDIPDLSTLDIKTEIPEQEQENKSLNDIIEESQKLGIPLNEYLKNIIQNHNA